MHWIDEVSANLKRKNQLLFGRDSEFLQELAELARAAPRRALILWALDLAAGSAEALKKKYPCERRPQEALEAARAWAEGRIKMPEARRSILACHAAAKQVTGREDAALCHAVGQACSVVHTAGHALGFPIYELTAIVYRHGLERCAGAVEARRQEYITRLFYWSERCDAGEWAKFLRG